MILFTIFNLAITSNAQKFDKNILLQKLKITDVVSRYSVNWFEENDKTKEMLVKLIIRQHSGSKGVLSTTSENIFFIRHINSNNTFFHTIYIVTWNKDRKHHEWNIVRKYWLDIEEVQLGTYIFSKR